MVFPVAGSRHKTLPREPGCRTHWPAGTVNVPAGWGGWTLSNKLPDIPPLGAGVKTLMLRAPAAATSPARMVALS